ncbi:hypothetical protein V2J09_008710 [Rumex salicifolius]
MGTQGDGLSLTDETSPDMLKNTPSNIKRLASEIEQCEGRHKYLAHTSSSSDGGDVRWYFCKVPLGVNQLAPSIPQTEIVGKGEYFHFGMRDSLAIEAAFLQREEELLSHWWGEYAECSIGPKERASGSSSMDLQQSSQTSELFTIEEERVGVPVKGGLYEVDLLRRHSFPVYWNGENRRVLRGHWFAQSSGLDWLPIREDVAEQLEYAYRRQVWHRRTFQTSGLFAARVDLQGSTHGLHALFTGEDDTWEAYLNVDASGFSSVINFGGNGIKLRRGYAVSRSPKPTQDDLRQQKEEEMDDYCSQVPVRHLVFMVHGIGQRLEKSNLVDDVTKFRHITSSLAEKHLTPFQRNTQRVLYIPCQWRKGLKLSSESAVEKITLDGVRGLRTTLSATVHDVLYYMSPIYCQDIIDSVSNQLNRLYLKFIKRNPGYEGKVSIYGHSLGSVLSYDILCHQENLSVPFPMDFMYSKRNGENDSSRKISKLSSESNVISEGLEGTSHSFNDQKNENITYPGDDNLLSENLAPVDLENNKHHRQSLSLAGEIFTKGVEEEKPQGSFSSSLESHESDSNCFETLTSVKEVLDEGIIYKLQDILALSDTTRASLAQNAIDKTSGEASATNEITSLKEKIALLSARVKDLESQVCFQETSASEKRHSLELRHNYATRSSSKQDDKPKSHKPYIKYTKLEFKVDTYFAVGSPLGVFLALRNVRIGIGEGKEYWEEENISEEMPSCRRMFNIFHPFDPNQRIHFTTKSEDKRSQHDGIEPLICKEYVSKRPVIIPYHKGGKRLHIGLQEFAEDVAAQSQAIMDQFNSMRDKVLTVCQTKNNDDLEEEEVKEKERSYGSIMIEQLTGREEGRVDHVLQDKTFRHAYLSALGSHTNYWRDDDTALFMLKHLYEDIPPQPQQPKRSSHEEYDMLTGGSDSTVDEQSPLTFSETSLIKNSSKASKSWNAK